MNINSDCGFYIYLHFTVFCKKILILQIKRNYPSIELFETHCLRSEMCKYVKVTLKNIHGQTHLAKKSIKVCIMQDKLI